MSLVPDEVLASNGISVGDKVTYVGLVEEERDKEFTVTGLINGFAQLEGRDDFTPMVRNLRPYVDVGPYVEEAPVEFVPHIVIDPATLPTIEQDPNNAHRLICGDTSFLPTTVAIAERVALRQVAVWHHLARVAQEDAAAAAFAETVRAKRRDELAVEVAKRACYVNYQNFAYEDHVPAAQSAISMILDMEAEK